jgi:carboxypeptidase family protein/TonB-dependent receptor-like protein
MLCALAVPASAQITTGNIAGTVKDAQGGVVPGATVILIDEAKGTKSAPAITDETGTYTFPNVTAATYTVEVTMSGFKTAQRRGVPVSGGDRVSVPSITLEVGGQTEAVTVVAESPLVQAQSGERSFAVTTQQVENLPINHGNFTSLVQLTPGVIEGGASAGGTRIGGAGQNNIMMDGISAMDTGNNGQMINMNIESIAEVKILTQGYQAEYGRSSGLQITAVSKSGTNRLRGGAYDLLTNSKWNTIRELTKLNRDPKPKATSKTLGYSIGGPVGKPGGHNKLFFFYSHEYVPTNNPINSGNPIRFRVPTAAERAGDFSQTLDNNGNPFPYIKDPLITGTCSATDQTACFADGGVVGKIPANRLYSVGLAILNRYPAPNHTQIAGQNYNYELGGTGSAALPIVKQLRQQPALRLDYQFSPKLRLSWTYGGDRRRPLTTPGGDQNNGLPGYTDSYFPYPFITKYSVNANYMLSPTMFLEGTYGFIRNELTGGNNGGILTADSANRLNGLAAFPLLYPDAGLVPKESYAYEVLQDVKPPFWDGTKMNLPPTFSWGGRIGAGPPNQQYPGWLNINRTQDVSISLTKIAGRHSLKGGFYNNHSFKAQNIGGTAFQGAVEFDNDSNNQLDTQFGYANAAVGVFRRYTQGSKFVEGSMLYNNVEGYVQDNWKVNSRLTIDAGVRFTHQQPQYDQFQQMSNFFPDQWKPSAATVLYVPGCISGTVCASGNNRNAMNPLTGQILVLPGSANSAAAIGTPVPGVGNPLNGIRRAGDGISKYGYTWPGIVVGPRFGVAYDLNGKQTLIFRGGGGIFYDRPDGNTVFSIPGNPPIATSIDLRTSTFQNLSTSASFLPVPGMQIFQYDAKVPASAQWEFGIQKTLPWSSVVDVSYVGNHGYNRLGAFQNGNNVNLNAVDFGAAYLPQNQDPTLGPQTVPGAGALPANLMRGYRGLGNINSQLTQFHDTYHSIQSNFNRRFRNGFSAGANYTLSLSFNGNTGLTKRLQHNADGSFSVRADQAEYEELNKQLDLRRHLLKANWVWSLPKLPTNSAAMKAVGLVLNDWQLSGIFSATSGSRYDLNYSYNTGGGAVNLTGSPDYSNGFSGQTASGGGARIIYKSETDDGCSSDRYKQFDTSIVAGPTYNSVGMESGRNKLIGCPIFRTDLAVARNLRFGRSGRQVQLRVDAFNLFNQAAINNRNASIQFTSPTDQTTIRNAQFCSNGGPSTSCVGVADGALDPNRLQPRNAGFGAATGWVTNQINGNYQRVIQITARIQF